MLLQRFEDLPIVRERQLHLQIPIALEGVTLAAFHPLDLRPHLRKVFCVLIAAEGGAGKTSLACQIGKSCLDRERPLFAHAAIPVLLDRDMLAAANNNLENAIRVQIRQLTDESAAPSQELVRNLQRRKRILLVLDGFSEFTDTQRSLIAFGNPDFDAKAVVITSRLPERTPGIHLVKVEPQRIGYGKIEPFLDKFLEASNKKYLFTDVELSEASTKLLVLAGDKTITVLLARMYAEEMIAAKQRGTFKAWSPSSIPELIQEYINRLNDGVAEKPMPARLVHHSLQIVAWECMRQTFQPGSCAIETLIASLGHAADRTAEEVLTYLETRLRLLETVGGTRDRLHFNLDPIAEYMAALYITHEFANDDSRWGPFLDEAAATLTSHPQIRSFLSAVLDCCSLESQPISVRMLQRLRQLLGTAAISQISHS